MKKKDEGKQEMPEAEAIPSVHVGGEEVSTDTMLKYAGQLLATDGKKILWKEKATPAGRAKLIAKVEKLGYRPGEYAISPAAPLQR